MNALMRRLTPAGLPWLVLHELRLTLRAARQRRGGNFIWAALIVIYTATGFLLASGLVHVIIPETAFAFTLALAICVLLVSLMVTQAMLRSQDMLYESGDLDLLLTAPLPPARVLMAKTVAIAGAIMLVFAALTLPVALPVALLGHPGLFGIPLLLVALAAVSACTGLAITLAVVGLVGPRKARTIARIVGAFLGAAVFLGTQFLAQGGGRRSTGQKLLGWLMQHDVGSHGLASVPGRAAFGEPLALAVVLILALGIFVGASTLLGRRFLTSYQHAPTRLAPRRARKAGDTARHFRTGLFRTMFAKEWRLLARDPQLAFTIVLRLIYLVPIAIPAFTHGNGPPLLPSLAFGSVLIAGQLAGSLAWLAVSGEESPDLLDVAPVARGAVERAKLATALVIAAPFAIVLPAAIFLIDPAAAAVTLAFTILAGIAAGYVELKFQKPAPRKSFGRRRDGSMLVGLITFLMTAVLGFVAGFAVYSIA